MKKEEILLQLKKELAESGADIKAEAVIMQVLQKGLQADDFVVKQDSFFYRPYSRDIFAALLSEDAWHRQLLSLHLSRPGLYDLLPEGLFYQPAKLGKKGSGAAEMSSAFKINKKKEQAIRSFFAPAENDIFWQRVQLEKEEASLLQGLQTGLLNDYFISFWNLSKEIPVEYVVPLALLFPYAHKITGNLELMAESLEKLLDEKVVIKKIRSGDSHAGPTLEKGLGTQGLGDDMITGKTFSEDYLLLEFTIGPLKHSGVTAYLQGGKLKTLLDTFYSYFTPAAAEIVTNMEVSDKDKNMYLKKEPVLGYSTVL